MILAMIILGLCIIGLFSASTFVDGNDKIMPFIWGVMFFVTVWLIVWLVFPDIHYEQGQIDALQNKWQYEEHYVYRDTVCIDTLYVKIK